MLYHLNLHQRSVADDAFTPAGVYLKLRDHFPDSLLLESSDYNGKEPAYSYICCMPLAGIEVYPGTIRSTFPDGRVIRSKPEPESVLQEVAAYIQQFQFPPAKPECCQGRFFGHMNFDAVQYVEGISLKDTVAEKRLPDIRFHLYRFVIVFDHVQHTVYFTEHVPEGSTGLGFGSIEAALRNNHIPSFPFDTTGDEVTLTSDAAYLEMVEQGKRHCRRGDVFQLVLSRGFSRPYRGDDFNVYRALRRINPSPYLFYFDYGNYRLFGSSPETQVKRHKGKTIVHPIAGTCRRSGDEEQDLILIEQLREDPKENAEHVMLVDLARNDLSKSHDDVVVTSYKTLQSFSHVVHMVSEVTGTQVQHQDALRLLAETFPAGTLSGAPKYRALQLIDQYEPDRRGYYGGTVGFLSPDGSLNQAIMIRSFMSRDQVLHYRAGAGIVESSKAEQELQEVHQKLAGLRAAIEAAKEA